MLGTYVLLDLVPKGRDEEALPFGMHWVRHHDRYDVASGGAFADADKPYWPKVAVAEASHSCCGSEKIK
jgi:hypothetical protein